MADDKQYMDIEEFQAEGYLQEVNRQFFHPLGLALSIIGKQVCKKCGRVWKPTEEGNCWLCAATEFEVVNKRFAVWDARDDPEGIRFDNDPDPDKVDRVGMEFIKRAPIREKALGYIIQPYQASGKIAEVATEAFRQNEELLFSGLKSVVVNDSGSQCDHCLAMTQTTLVRTCTKCGAPKHG